MESAETFYADNESLPGNIALDAASLLKQWIRELPEPIIPYKVHEALLQRYETSQPRKCTNKGIHFCVHYLIAVTHLKRWYQDI